MIKYAGDLADTGDDFAADDPTPDQIRRRAAAIRKGWSKRTRQRRRVALESTWRPPTVRVTDLAATASEAFESGGFVS